MTPNLNIDVLIRGTIDMHVHFGPDALMPFRLDALETARSAQQLGMRAIVLKAHTYPSAALATLVGKLVPEVKVYGSICLDYEVGGLNFHALTAAAKLGARVVWMPTHSSHNEKSKPAGFTQSKGFSIINSKNKLVPEIDKILSLIKEHGLVLATGHITPQECFALVEAATIKGISKIVITHALTMEFLRQSLTLSDIRKLAKMGAYIEHSYVGFLPNELRLDPKNLVEVIKTVGAEHCILSTDLGQYENPPPGEGMRMFIALLLRNGITEREIELMAKLNPAKLLDLD
jgi:hypothetical protein